MIVRILARGYRWELGNIGKNRKMGLNENWATLEKMGLYENWATLGKMGLDGNCATLGKIRWD